MNNNSISRVVVVVNADTMSDATFVRHYNARHLEDIGLGEVRIGSHVAALRAFHRRCHRLESYQHEHRGDNDGE